MRHCIPTGQPPVVLREYMQRALPNVPAWAVRQTLMDRQVKRGGQRLSADDLVQGGEELAIYLPRTWCSRPQSENPSEAIQIQTVYEDEHIWVVNKPQGIASQQADDPRGEPGVLECLQREAGAQAQRWGLRLCHRLDHHTGGLLLLAKHAGAEAALRAAFAKRAIEKTYTCLTVGTPQPEQATVHAYLRKDAVNAHVTVQAGIFFGAHPIQTVYRVLAPGDIARVQVELITGRTHQIRAHMAFIGHPILGDDKYGDRAANKQYGVARQQLWATRLVLHVGGDLRELDGRVFEVEAPF